MSGTRVVLSVLLDCDDGPLDGLRPAIDSVLGQVTPELELLLVGSRADRGDLATALDGDRRIRWLGGPPDGSHEDAIGSALREADGEMITFLTPNDMLLAHHGERMMAILEDAGVDAVVSRPAWVTQAGRVVPLPRPPWPNAAAGLGSWLDLVPACAVMCRRSALLVDAPFERNGVATPWGRLAVTRQAGVGSGAGLTWLDDVTTLRFGPPTLPSSSTREAAALGWLEELGAHDSWPSALTLDLSGGRSVRRAVEGTSPGWCDLMQAAVPDALERMAWDRLDDHAGEPAHDMRVIEALQARVRTLEQERSSWSQGRVDAPRAVAVAATPGVQPLAERGDQAHRRRTARARRARRAASSLLSMVMARLWNPLFDARWYRQRYSDVPGGLRTWVHWRRHGWHEARDPNPWFDTSWYVRRYPDVAGAGTDPLEHYLRWGWREGRDPSPRFDARAYRHRHPDVASAGIDPLLHYIRHGRAEGRRVDPVAGSRQARG